MIASRKHRKLVIIDTRSIASVQCVHVVMPLHSIRNFIWAQALYELANYRGPMNALMDTSPVARLIDVVEVDYRDRVRCQADGYSCGGNH